MPAATLGLVPPHTHIPYSTSRPTEYLIHPSHHHTHNTRLIGGRRGGGGPQNRARPTSRGRPLAALGAPKRSRARGHLRAASIAERTRASMFGRFAHAACLALGGRRLPLPHSFSIMFIRSPRTAVGRYAPSVSLRLLLVRHDILLPQEPRVSVTSEQV